MTSLHPDMLRSFVAIADSGSFSRAALQVNRTQSAVSMQVKKLEELVGKSLLVRDNRSNRLTHEGQLLLNYARRIIQLNDESVSLLQRPELAGSVRIGLPDDYATRFLPEILANFSRTFPQVQVEVICQPSNRLKELLAEDRLDLALTSSSIPHVEGTRLLSCETMIWAGTPQHLVHEKRPLPLAVFEADCYWRSSALAALEQAGIPYRIAYASASYTGLIAATGAGLAITVLIPSVMPENLCRLGPEAGLPTLADSSVLLRRNPRSGGPITDCLAEHIVQAFKAGQE